MKVRQKFENCLDNYKVKGKLQILYLICVLLPLIVTDSAVIYIAAQSDETSRQHRMESVANAVQYSLINQVEITARTAKNIYMNKYIDRFLESEYRSPLDYVNKYQVFVKNTLFESASADSTLITMYADNDTIVSGGIFGRVGTIRESAWYQYLKQSKEEQVLYYYYDGKSYPEGNRKRKLVFVRKLDFYKRGKEKVLKLEMDYSKLLKNLVKMDYGMPVYICDGDTVVLSNNEQNRIGKAFDTFSLGKKTGYRKSLNLYGLNLKVYVIEPKEKVMTELIRKLPIVLILVVINIILPLILMKGINRSFTVRLRELSEVFDRVEEEKLVPISDIRGSDEIGSLMRNYNKMAERINQLIQIVYKNKLKEQEMDIARQNAELLALHSQINPHFMFNALESIRMHSILKEEFETADMVEKLAAMARQNVDWGNDLVEVSKEMEFVKAYLGLQKYRFGERLSYELEVEEDCKQMKIPKLTVVTFVENACVHGIESKLTPGWIFVRAFQEEHCLCLEIEDTGCGMEPEFMEELHERMEHASMETLKDKGRVGIVNACLRLKMLTKNEVHFELDGEKGVGTMVQIRIPLAYV